MIVTVSPYEDLCLWETKHLSLETYAFVQMFDCESVTKNKPVKRSEEMSDFIN